MVGISRSKPTALVKDPNARFEKFTLLPQANFELSFRFSCKKGLLLALAENSGAIPAMSGSHMLL
jgi:hypothetical protein